MRIVLLILIVAMGVSPLWAAGRPMTVDDLLKLKTGFRAKYIFDAVKRISGGEISLNGMLIRGHVIVSHAL